MTDEEQEPRIDRLMQRVAEGDALAFQPLYHALFPVVEAFVRKYADRNASIEDIAQESFYRLWTLRERFDGSSSSKTFLLGIALNIVREDRAARRRQHKGNSNVSQPLAVNIDLSADMEQRESQEILQRATENLPDRDARALRLVYEQCMRPAEGAKALGCTEKAFRRRLEEARKRLFKTLRHRVASLFD